jgi:hypothetical protein
MGYMIQRLQPSSMKRYQKRKDIGKVTENNFEYVVVGVYGDWYKDYMAWIYWAAIYFSYNSLLEW